MVDPGGVGDAGRRLAQPRLTKVIDLLHPRRITPIRCGACSVIDTEKCEYCGHEPERHS